MGVNFKDLIPKTQVKLEDLSGKIIAIDAYNAIYQFLSIIRQPDGTPLKDSTGKITSHLSGLFYRTSNLIEMGIILRSSAAALTNPPASLVDCLS